MSFGDSRLLKPCLELGEPCVSSDKGILGRPDFSRHIKGKTVQTGRIIEQHQKAQRFHSINSAKG